jgi:hypothetical protein
LIDDLTIANRQVDIEVLIDDGEIRPIAFFDRADLIA